MSKLVKRDSASVVGSTIETYRVQCNDGCEVKDVPCNCYGTTPSTGSTTTVAAKGSTSC